MPRKIWSRLGNPPRSVATVLGISPVQLGEALHAIKDGAGLSPRDRVSIWDDGSIPDDADAWIGNIYDEICPGRPNGICRPSVYGRSVRPRSDHRRSRYGTHSGL